MKRNHYNSDSTNSFSSCLGELPLQAQDPTQEERIARLEEAYTHLATKEDLAKLQADIATLQGELNKVQGELKVDIASLRGELKADIATLQGELNCKLKADIVSLRGELKADIASLRGELRGMQWMLGGGFIILIAVTLWVNREKKSDPSTRTCPALDKPTGAVVPERKPDLLTKRTIIIAILPIFSSFWATCPSRPRTQPKESA